MSASGDWNMDVEAAEQQMRTIAQAGQAVGQSWQAVRGAVGAGADAIGSGPLADAFRGPYTALSSKVGTEADRIPQSFQELSSAGNDSVAVYVAHEQAAAAALEALR